MEDGQQILYRYGWIYQKTSPPSGRSLQKHFEEAKYADYIIHVVDASNPQAEKQMEVVYDTLRQLGASGKKIVTLFNKQDLIPECELRDPYADYVIKCSAKTGQGLDEFGAVLSRILAENLVYLEELYSYRQAEGSRRSAIWGSSFLRNTGRTGYLSGPRSRQNILFRLCQKDSHKTGLL